MKKNSIPKLELVFLLLLTGMCPQAHATDDGRNASPQKTYAVDLTLGSATVLTFTEAVTSQTGVLFSYESALSQMPLGDVSVHETAAPLEHILEKVFKGRGFRYKVVDRIVVLTYDTDSARSQLVLVTGRVKDGSGMPLVGASVVVKDTMRGVSAGAEGNYRIFADPDATLVFSYIGYADREERIGTRSAIDVVLEEYEAVLEDVVVVGYGTQSRRTVTAAISKFDGHLLEGIPVNSVGDALKGRVPGVRVATTDATPGADPKFLIRGGSSINQSNDPIVLVDGVVREMAGLNPNDIESVSFLKDAAAAGIYGSRASNGVILITTKKGSKHLGPRIVFEGQWAWASPATKFDLMNARDYILTVRPALMEGYCGGMDPASVLGGEQSAGTGNTAKSLWTTRYLRPDEPVPAGYQWVEDPVNPGRIIVFEDNDQQSQWFGDACWQNYYVGIDGGGDNIQYAASAGYTDDSGIGITTGYSRFTFHGNTTFQVTRRLRASTTFDYSQIEQQTFESAPLSLRNSVIRGLSVPNTHRDWYGEEAGEELAGTPALGTNNTTIPAAYYAYYYHNAGSTIKRSTATINLDWEVFDGLRLVGQFTNYNRHTRSYFYVEDNPTTGSNIRPMKEGFSETNRMDFQAYADYKGTFGNGHRLGAVAGYEYMLDKLNSFDVRVQGAVSDKLPVLDAGTSNIANYPKSTRTRECLISYFGRVNYDYGGRYLLAATMRIDGSSKFAAGHRWGYFPAASAGWVVSKEGFWPQNSVVSMLKARVSYGLTGNNGIGLYDTYGSYNSLYTYNGNATTTTNTMPNNGLIWEKTLQFNAGIDLGLLDNRITLALDYYNKETRDLLFDVSLPNTTGYNSVSTNLGRVRFYGTELSLSSVNIDRKGFSWRTDFTYSYNMNRVLELPDNGNPRNRINGISVGDGSQFGGIAEGERMGRIFGYVAERIIETQEEADAARYDTQSRGYRRSDRRQIAGRKDIGGNAVRGTVADRRADARIGEPFSKPRGTQRTRPHARIAGENHLADMCREVLRGLYGGRPALRGGDCACRHILRSGGTPDEGRRHEQRHRRGDQHPGQHDEGLAFGSHGQHRNDAAGRSRRHQSGPGKRKEQQPGGTARNRGEDQRRARQDIGKIDFVDTAEELDDYGAGRRLARITAAEKPAGQQYAQPGPGIRLQQEHDRLPGFAGLLDADRREDAVVQGIIEEQHLGRLDQKRHERQQSVADHDLHAVADQQRQPRHRTADDPIAQYGQQHTEDAYREIAHEHLEARLYASLRKFVEPPDRIPAQRAHDHGSDEHRDVAADDDAHGGNGPDYPAAFAGDVAPGRIGD